MSFANSRTPATSHYVTEKDTVKGLSLTRSEKCKNPTFYVMDRALDVGKAQANGGLHG